MMNEFESQLVKIFEERGLLDSLYTIAIFGSTARTGDYKHNGDIDLLLLVKDYSNISKIGETLKEFQKYFENNGTKFYFIGNFTFRETNRPSENSIPIHILHYTPSQFEEIEHPEVVNSILRQNKVIYGKPVEELVKSRLEGDVKSKTAKLKQLLANTLFNLSTSPERATRQARQIAKYVTKHATSYSIQGSEKYLELSTDFAWLQSPDPFEIIQKAMDYVEEVEKHA
jgi:predicted nucleotidyltransferase